MSKHLSSFEQSVKKSLEGAELPYESDSWTEMENRLNKIDSSTSTNNNIRWAIAAGLIIAGATFFTYQFNNTEKPSLPIVENSNNTDAIEKAIKTKTENYNSNQEKTDSSLTEKEVLINDTTTTTTTTTTTSNKTTIENKTPKDNGVSEKTDIDVTKKETNISPNSVNFVPSIQQACEGTEINFDLTTNEIEGSYLWNFGDGNFSNEKNPNNVYTKPGIYSVTLAVTSELDGVIKSNTKPVLITVTPIPTADFDWEFVSEYNEVPTVKVINKSLNAIESEWSINNQAVSNEINLIKSFEKKGEYLLSLKVANTDGCTNTKYKSISIKKDYNILAPKTFSPNNDGKNDTFIPKSLRVLNKEFELSIYSNDQLVYQTKDATKAWNGKLKDGSKAQVNQKFPWVVILYDTNGNKQYYSGIVTVVP